jgi:hypothetical protein
MFGGNKIKLEKDLYDRLIKVVEVAGYSSVEEFVTHVIERELNEIDPGGGQDPAAMREKLKGLGYIS